MSEIIKIYEDKPSEAAIKKVVVAICEVGSDWVTRFQVSGFKLILLT